MHSGQQEQRADKRQKEHQRRLGQSEQTTAWLSHSRAVVGGLRVYWYGRELVRGKVLHLAVMMAQRASTTSSTRPALNVVPQIPCFFRISSMSEKSSAPDFRAGAAFPPERTAGTGASGAATAG